MATAASVTTDLTTCPICLDVFDNPKSLPCLHAFCLKCLQGHFKDSCLGDEVPCPMCRKEFEIPSEGLDALQHHFIVQRLVDIRKVSSEEFRGVPCVVCLEGSDGSSEETATATVYCVDCRQKMCERCSRPHRRMAGGAHQLKPLGAELEQELIQLRASSCDKHHDKQVELYCHQCNENICLMCSAVKHRNHECTEISEAAQTFRARIDEEHQRIASSISSLRRLSEQIKQDLNKFVSDVDNVEKKAVEAGDEIRRMVDKQVSELVSKLQSVKSDSAKQAQAVQDQLQLALVAMESFHTYSRELLDNGRPSDVTRAAAQLHDRATELMKNDVTAFYFRPPHVTFAPADVTQLERFNLVGKVTVESGDHEVGRVLQTLSCGARGVTSLDNLLYVLRDVKSSEQIAVYDTDSYRLRRRLTVPRLGNSDDIVACSHNRCAYISDWSNHSVHRLSLPGAHVVTLWPVNDEPAYLSVTHKHSVLVTCYEVRKIKEFSTDGQLLRQVELPPDVVSPLHTVQLSTGEFVVCHGLSRNPVHRVCVVDCDGRVVRSYGGSPGSGCQQMNLPVHLAVDRNEFVFVTDFNNRRVLLLSPSLTYVREVLSRDQLSEAPERLCLDADKSRLYVAAGGQVLVVSV